jgi:hypothetical protein
MATRLLHS